MPRFIRPALSVFLSLAVFITLNSCSAEKQPIPGEIPVEGAENFRDLGGYETSDGHTVKSGMLYRSGHLHDLTAADTEYLKLLGIREIADFRGPSEIENEPDIIPEGIIWKSYPVDIAGSDLREKIISVIKGDSDMDMTGYMLDVNRQFAEKYSGVYGEWIRDLADDPDSSPQVFHCTAGKDRAGFAAALILSILGVPRDTVIEDYLKSNLYNAEYIDKTIRKIRVLSFFRNDGEVILPILTVNRQYLQTAFDSIDAEWGSFDNYIRQGLKLSDEDVGTLKNRFLD